MTAEYSFVIPMYTRDKHLLVPKGLWFHDRSLHLCPADIECFEKRPGYKEETAEFYDTVGRGCTAERSAGFEHAGRIWMGLSV